MKRQVVLSALALAGLFVRVDEAAAQTRVVFYADTEDYTCDESNDGIRDFANALAKEGVRGCFNITGYLALRIQELGRTDVIDALKAHCLGTQTLYHTLHPTPSEIADDPDYERAYRRALADEARAFGMVEAVFGEGRVAFTCPCGSSISLGALEAWTDLGHVFAAGNGYTWGKGIGKEIARPGWQVDGLWYFNQYQPPYCQEFSMERLIPGQDPNGIPDFKKVLDTLAQYDFAGIGFHPNMQIHKLFWDKVNYDKGNLVPWRQWKPAPKRDPKDTAQFYVNVGAFLRAMKADGRFRITDFDEMKKGIRPRVAITAADLPAIRASLRKDFNCIREPASWCVSDVFQAVVKMLGGAKTHAPGKVYGFLHRPVGVSAPTEVSAAGLRAAAANLDLGTFLPPQIDVDGRPIGPADFLFAALDVLIDGTDKVTVTPREQLGSFKEVKALEKMNLAGSWLHTPDFKDKYVSERIRLQLWTLRLDPTDSP